MVLDPRLASRFSTLSAKSRAALYRPPPPPPVVKAPEPERPLTVPASPSLGISVDEAWALFGIVKKRATEDEVKQRYRKLAAKYHPDRNASDQAAATKNMMRINAAYAALKRHCKW